MHTLKHIHLWVSNMDAVGADADYTTDYLRHVSAGDLAAHFHCHIEEQILHGRTNDIWPCFRCLSRRISDAGHGGATEDAPAPILVARLPDSVGAAATLQEIESITAPDWDAWVAASLIEQGPMTGAIKSHIASLSPDARQDIAAGQWDEVMTDALYAACGAQTVEEMAAARGIAEDAAQ